MQRLLNAHIEGVITPHRSASRLTTLANHNITRKKSVPIEFSILEPHFFQIGQIKTKPTYVGVPKIWPVVTFILIFVQHLAQHAFGHVRQSRPFPVSGELPRSAWIGCDGVQLAVTLGFGHVSHATMKCCGDRRLPCVLHAARNTHKLGNVLSYDTLVAVRWPSYRLTQNLSDTLRYFIKQLLIAAVGGQQGGRRDGVQNMGGRMMNVKIVIPAFDLG